MSVWVRDVPGGALVAVKVVPGASRNRLAGMLGDRLKITTSAPAEKGRANAAAARLLAAALGVAHRDVTCVSGPVSPRKEFRVEGLSASRVRELLEGA